MKSSALIVTGLSDFSVSITPDAMAQKEDALSLAASVIEVSNAREQQDAISGAAICKSLAKSAETSRVEWKEPVLTAGRAIDDTAKKYKAELLNEADRLESLAARYQAEQNRIAAAARATEEARQRELAAAAERQRLAELAEAQERESVANAARLADLERIQSAKDDAAREEAQRQADIAAEARARKVREEQLLAEEMAGHRAEQLRAQQMQLAALAPPKVEGARVSVSYDYELLDIRALYAARPDLVKLEERRAQILAAINVPGAPPIAGLRVFEQTKLVAKALA